MKQPTDDEVEWLQAKVNRVFAEAVPSRWRPDIGSVYHPPTDVYETDEHVVVIVEIAGLGEGDYELILSGRSLFVQGHRRDPSHKLAYQQMEIRYGDFQTQVYLPWALQTPEAPVEAVYDQGLLRIQMRKARTHRVPVRSDDDTEE